jgi:Tfp pilus assembly protein PilZ
MDIPLHYRLSRRSSDRGEPQLYSGRVENISGAGVFMRTMHTLPAGSEVEMDILLERNKKPKSVKGIVLWVADRGLQPELYPGMGVAFTVLPSHIQEEIIEFIEKNAAHFGR